MKVKPILANMSGRLQGIVASHNRGGQYFRGRTIPDTPPTPDQTAARVNMTSCVNRWATVLTEAQREAWNNYAVANPITDGFGSANNAGGLGWFVRTNAGRLQCGLAYIDAAPLINGPAGLTIPVFTLTTDQLTVAFEVTDDWTGDGGALAVFASAAQSPTRVSAAGISLRFVGPILGDATPPTTPQVLTLRAVVTAPQGIFLRAVALAPDGRRSAEYRTFLAQ